MAGATVSMIVTTELEVMVPKPLETVTDTVIGVGKWTLASEKFVAVAPLTGVPFVFH